MSNFSRLLTLVNICKQRKSAQRQTVTKHPHACGLMNELENG